MQRTALGKVYSLTAALLLLLVCFSNNIATVDQALSIICHQVLGLKDVSHSENHVGSSHEHRHPGQDEPHRHGDPAQVFVVSDHRADLKTQSVVTTSSLFLACMLAGAVFLSGLLLSGIYAAVSCFFGSRPPGWVFVAPRPVPVRVLISSPNAPPYRRR